MENTLFRFIGSTNHNLLMNALRSEQNSDGALKRIVKKDKHITRKIDGFFTYVKKLGGYAGIRGGHVHEAQDVTDILLNKPKAFIATLRGFTYSSTYFTSLLKNLKKLLMINLKS